jgi:hypothetical protein
MKRTWPWFDIDEIMPTRFFFAFRWITGVVPLGA